MWAFLERLLDSSMFSPHGICLLWEPELIWLHVVSDAVIAASYFSIPFALAIVVSKRREFPVWLDRMVVRGLHHGVRPHPYFFDLYAVGAGLRHRRHRQGRHRDRVNRHRCCNGSAKPRRPRCRSGRPRRWRRSAN